MAVKRSEAGKPRLGISTCLLGEHVRYDGGHKLDRYLTDTLGSFVEWVPVCPEAECGLGVPREAMRLVGDPASPRLVTQKTGIDHTHRMKMWARERLEELEEEDLDGFVFKARSPSCSLKGVEVFDRTGTACGTATGLWAEAFAALFPDLPTAEERDLHDARTRENFTERIISRAHRRSSRGP